MTKEQVLSKIQEAGIVAVVRAESSDQAKRIADACIEGGVAAIELTFTVPMSHRVIEDLAATYTKGEIILGAGTVLDPETARIAILSGAEYIVSPFLNSDGVRLCNRYHIACMPGIMTIRDAVEALELGVDILKLFPGEAFGPKMIKAIAGPLPQAQLMPTGGVTVDNVGEWISAGAVAVGAGGALTAGAKRGDYASITKLGREFVENIRAARQKNS
jgi:2-dehydro-3-deoxyphosphogluconate aldolase/(4S)-4-hydroxy-2-oxoglutarate aldolase